MFIPVYRDQAQVLKEDREKLHLLQPMQPWFTREQKEELAEVHSWIQHHIVPKEINTRVRSSINRSYVKYIKVFFTEKMNMCPCVFFRDV